MNRLFIGFRISRGHRPESTALLQRDKGCGELLDIRGTAQLDGGEIPPRAELADNPKETEGVHHGGVHPLAQITGIVPAARGIDVDSVVAAARVVEMTGGMNIGNRYTAALGAMVAGDLRKKAAP